MSMARKAGSDGTIIVWDSPSTKVYHNTVLANANIFYSIEFRFKTTTNGEARNNLADLPIIFGTAAAATESGNLEAATPGLFVAPASANLHLQGMATAVIDQALFLAAAADDFDGDADRKDLPTTSEPTNSRAGQHRPEQTPNQRSDQHADEGKAAIADQNGAHSDADEHADGHADARPDRHADEHADQRTHGAPHPDLYPTGRPTRTLTATTTSAPTASRGTGSAGGRRSGSRTLASTDPAAQPYITSAAILPAAAPEHMRRSHRAHGIHSSSPGCASNGSNFSCPRM